MGEPNGHSHADHPNQMDEYYLAYEERPSALDYRVNGKATLNLADGTNSSERLSVSKSTFAHPGPVEPSHQSRTMQELQKSHVFDGGERTPTPQSTHKGAYVHHPVQDSEPFHSPKPQVDLSMPSVDPKDSYNSSYRTSHTGQSPSADDVAHPSPNITFQSRVLFEDGEKNRSPHQSTQKENYTSLPLPDNTPHPPPKPQVDLSMPNIDPKDAYHSSYKTSHTVELPSANDIASPVPSTTFQSRVVFEDGEKNRAPHQSTQQGNYVAHAIPDHEHHPPPKPQVDLSMPNLDPNDAFQSSYKQSHKGEQLAENGVTIPHTAFQSSLLLEDLENSPTPQSTHRGQFVAHSVQEVEAQRPRPAQVDLTMPHVDPKDSYHSSYQRSHTGERPSAEHEHPPVPRTAFQSAVVFEGGEKTPHQSTQKGNYVAHQLPDAEHHRAPSPQVDLSMPNVDPRDTYHSSYKSSHTGEAPSADNTASPVPNITFQSRVVFEDGEKNRAPHQSTQQGNYVTHPAQEITSATRPKPQVNLSMPNVDPKDAYYSSYKTSHTGEALSLDDVASPIPNITFQSRVVFEDGDKNRTPQQSTQKDNYVTHPVQDTTPPSHPKPQVNLSMPNVDPKDTYHSSYEIAHTGEALSADDVASPVPNSTFQSRVLFEDGDKNRTPHKSTQKENYITHPVQDTTPATPPKPQVNLSMPNVDPKDSYHSSYKTSHTGEIPSADDVASPAPNTAFQSRILFEDGEKNRTPHKSTQKENYITHLVQDTTPATPPKNQVDLSMPNVDPQDSYHSSYKTAHTGKTLSADDVASPAPPTTFQSRVVFEDGSKNRTHESTQKGNYVAHPTQEQEAHSSPKPQIDLSMPNVKESYQSSYKQAHKGDKLSPDDEQGPIARTAFQSTVSLEGGDTVPHQSTQKGNYVAHPVQEHEPHLAPKAQVDLSMPNVDSRDSYQSSYKHTHRGEAPAENDEHSPIARTAFQSSVVLEGGEKVRHQSTQKGNYVAHPVQELEHHQSPKSQVDFTQPNVDQKDLYQSSYKQSHRGEQQSAEHEHAPISHTAFQSSVVLEDGDKTQAQSTHKQSFVAHPVQETRQYSPSKPQVDFSQPNVNPKDTFQSSYNSAHKGETLFEETIAVPQSTFKSSFAFDDGDKHRTPHKSTQKDNYISHPVQDQEPRAPPKAQLSLRHSDVDPKDAYQSSYKHVHTGEIPSEDDEVVSAPRTTFKSSVAFEDGDKTKTPRKSTQQENYVAHPIQDKEHYSSPKPQISLAQQNVNPKEVYQSSYNHSHKGETLSADEEAVASPNTTFKSSVAFEDGHKPTTHKSTQRENYVAHPTPDVEHYTPPKSQLSLTQPNIDSKDTYQSSYKQTHKGEAPSADDDVAPAPRTTFKSSVAFDDGEKNRTPRKSTQHENYVAHPTPDVEHYTPPKPQISFTQPNVDPKDTYQSSYRHTHKGEAQSVDDEIVAAPRTTFKSSVAFDDGEKIKTPHKSTQHENYVSHPMPEAEHYAPPRAQVSLAQPNVDLKDTFQSSYNQSHKGEALSTDDQSSPAPNTTFKSSVAFDDGEKIRTPHKSTQRENYVSHPTPDIEHYTPPKSQISLTQPNVDPKESFQSSYKQVHKGEAPSAEDEVSRAPPRTFQSSLNFADGERIRSPQLSTQHESYISHALPDHEPHHSPKPQVDLTMPHVDPKESYKSSYNNTHKGEPLLPGDEAVSSHHNAFSSNFSLEEGYKTPQTTQKGNYVVHPIPKTEHHTPPKPQVNLTQPNVTPRDTFQSSYKSMHRGESPAPNDQEPRTPPRSAFKSSITLDGGHVQEPLETTSKHSYAAPTISNSAKQDQARVDAGRKSRSSNIMMGDDASPHMSTSSSAYARPPQDAIINGSPSKPTKNAWESSLSLGDKEKDKYLPVPTSREAYSPRLNATQNSPSRTRPSTASQISLGGDQTTSYNTTSTSSFTRSPNLPKPVSPVHKSADIQKSSIQLSSGEPTRMSTTSQSSFASPPEPLSPARSPTPSSYSPYKRSSFSFGGDEPSYHTTSRTMYSSPPPTPSPSSPSLASPSSPSVPLSPARSPAPTASPSRHSHLRSSFSLG